MQVEDMKVERRVELIEQGSQLFATACHEAEIDVANTWPASDEELKRSAYSDHYGKEMGWLQ